MRQQGMLGGTICLLCSTLQLSLKHLLLLFILVLPVFGTLSKEEKIRMFLGLFAEASGELSDTT